MRAHPARWTHEHAGSGGLGAHRAAALSPHGVPRGRLGPLPPSRPQTTTERIVPVTAGFATYPLAASPASPAVARQLTRATLRGWDLGELVDDSTTIVSELVTNALRYGFPRGPSCRPLPPATEDQPVLLGFVHRGRSVLCAVFDPGRDVPTLKEPDYLRESGRGLHVLEALALRWGWTPPDEHGKAVWALLPAAREARLPQPDPVAAERESLTRLLRLMDAPPAG